MDICKYLTSSGVDFELTLHEHVFTAQEVAASEHVTGHIFAKTVIVRVAGRFHMLVLPGSRHVDMHKVADLLGGEPEMATEAEMKQLFEDCEIGAEPPFGSRYGINTLLDESLMAVPHIVFRAGNHEHTVKMALEDYAKLEGPAVGDFTIE